MTHEQAAPQRLSRGHCFVCLAALAEPVVGRWVALFLTVALYVPKRASTPQREFASKPVLAACLVNDLPLPPQTPLVVVADGAYARRSFVKAVVEGGRHVLSRLRSDAVFYDLPPARRKRADGTYPPGRPLQYGQKHKAPTWAENGGEWQSVKLTLYGRKAAVALKTREGLHRRLGVRMRVVAVRWGTRPLVFLFCTDTTMTAAAIVQAYCARFALETGFRDAKQSFRLATYQVRKEQSIVRLVHLSLWGQTLLRLCCWGQKPTASYGDWRKPLDYLTLSQQKRLSQAACRVWDDSVGTLPSVEKGSAQSTAV